MVAGTAWLCWFSSEKIIIRICGIKAGSQSVQQPGKPLAGSKNQQGRDSGGREYQYNIGQQLDTV